MVNEADVVDKGIIDNNVEYVSLIRHEMSRNYHSLRIEGSVDVKNCDCNRYMPILILDIKDVVWHRFDIGCNNGDTTNFQTVNFNYELACPIDKSLKGKTLKLYFWNNDKGAAAFENADVKVLY